HTELASGWLARMINFSGKNLDRSKNLLPKVNINSISERSLRVSFGPRSHGISKKAKVNWRVLIGRNCSRSQRKKLLQGKKSRRHVLEQKKPVLALNVIVFSQQIDAKSNLTSWTFSGRRIHVDIDSPTRRESHYRRRCDRYRGRCERKSNPPGYYGATASPGAAGGGL